MSLQTIWISTLLMLSVALNNFEGGLVVVSYNEYFFNGLCDRLTLLKNIK